MSPSIAGATTTGADDARQVAVTTSPGQTGGHRASQCAVAGATTMASAVSATTMWPIRPSGSRSRTSVSTGWRDSAANDSGPTKRVADGVSITDDVGALGAQEAQQLDGLVGGDRAGDAEPDEPTAEAAVAPARSRQAQLERLAAADLGVEDGQTLERQVGVDGVDVGDAGRPRRRGQAAGQDRPDVRVGDAVRVGQLASDAREEPVTSAW